MSNNHQYQLLTDRAIILVEGADSPKLLGSMLTNKLLIGSLVYSYILNNQGRYLFDIFLYQTDQSIFIDVAVSKAKALIRHLEIYKLRSAVQITDVSNQYVSVYSTYHLAESIISQIDPRYQELKYRSILSQQQFDKLIGEKTDNLYLADKYQYSIIDGDIDLVFGKSIPIEYGMEELNAVDFHKGCYIGQEVISRAKYQGVIRKKIFQLTFAENTSNLALKPHILYQVTDDLGVQFGKICSVWQQFAIAILKEEKFLRSKDQTAIVENNLVQISVPPWRKQ